MTFPVLWHHRENGGKDFSPADITGLQLWIDFSDPTTLFTDAGTTPVAADADKIYQANDKSGNGRNAIQTTDSKRPLYKLAVKNGKSASLHDGIDNCLAASFGATLSQPNTIIFVLFVPNQDAGYSNAYDGISSGNRHSFYQNPSGAAKNSGLYAGANPEIDITLDRWVILSIIWNSTSSKVYENGTQNGGTINVGTHTLTGLTIGGRYNLVEAWNSYIADVIVYSGALSDADRALVETYLNAKWAVY